AGVYFALVAAGYHWLIHKRTHRAASHIHGETQQAYKLVQQSIEAAREVQVTQTQDYFVDQLRTSKQAMAGTWRTVLLLMQVPRYSLEGALIIGFGFLSLVVFNLRATTEATAVLALFLASGFRMLPSLNRVLVTLGTVRASSPALEQITSDLAKFELEPSQSGPSLRRPPSIEFRHVGFTYQAADRPALHDFSSFIEPGKWIGVVGASGSGKTTLLNLVLGLLDPSDGEILIDDIALVSARSEWQRMIGYVPQQV